MESNQLVEERWVVLQDNQENGLALVHTDSSRECAAKWVEERYNRKCRIVYALIVET